MMHRLFKLEREAEQRVHDARDREIDLGGPGSARRASEAMDAPMLEVAKIRKTRQRLGDKQMEIDHQTNLLRRTSRNPRLPSDVKRFRTGQAEARLAGLEADFNALEVEAEQTFFGGTMRVADAAAAVGDNSTDVPSNFGSDQSASRQDLPSKSTPRPNEPGTRAPKKSCADLTVEERKDLLNSHKAADNADLRTLQEIDRLENRIRGIETRLNHAKAELDKSRKELSNFAPSRVSPLGNERKRGRGRKKDLLREFARDVLEVGHAFLSDKKRAQEQFERWSATVKRLQAEKAEAESELVAAREERVRASDFLRVVSGRVREFGCVWSAGEWENALSGN